MKKRRFWRKIRNEAAAKTGLSDSCISALPKNSSFMDFLPPDLLHEIFLRLPCKYILSCKCVCRAWYKLLSHPNFTCNYTRNSPFKSFLFIQSLHNTNSVFLLEFAANGGVIKRPIKPKIPDFQRLDSRKMPHDEQINSRLHIIGSCNGLLFLVSKNWNFPNGMVEKVFCWNPLLEGCVVLVEQNWPYQSRDLQSVDYFLGYISSTNRFKVLRIVSEWFYGVKHADILTVGIDHKWRRVDDHSNLYYHRSGVSFNGAYHSGVSFNGAYHWIVWHENLWFLSTFDFGEEKSGWISKLPAAATDLVVLNNHLSLIDVLWVNYQITMWTMEEYGVAESWSRKIILRDPYLRTPNFCVAAASQNGDILFSECRSGKIVSLNPEKRRTVIKVDDAEPFTHTLHAAEFAPRFYLLDEDIRGKLYRHTGKVWSNIFCFVLLGIALLFARQVILLIS